MMETETEALKTLQHRPLPPPILALARRNRPCTLHPNAFDSQLGYVLLQEQLEEPSKLLRYLLKHLDKADQAYDRMHRYCLLFVRDIQLLRPYLDVSVLVIGTDHKALQ